MKWSVVQKADERIGELWCAVGGWEIIILRFWMGAMIVLSQLPRGEAW